MSTLSIGSMATILLVTAFAAVPLGACGGTPETQASTTSGSGGSTSSTTGTSTSGTGGSGNDDGCSGYCQSLLACATPANCVLVNPAGAQSACAASCKSAIATLDAADKSLVDACLACADQAAAGQCLTKLPPGSCSTTCGSATTETAMEKWQKIVGNAPVDPAGACTNGRNALSNEECQGGGDGTSCTSSCCNGKCGATPDVGASCALPASGPAACTCTAGKNTGKTFQEPSGMCVADDIWNQCNL